MTLTSASYHRHRGVGKMKLLVCLSKLLFCRVQTVDLDFFNDTGLMKM